MILLGWKIGSGERVEIPETGHLAWFGQTQLSGKTTALEAIAFRGGLKAVAFITKQGEGGFLTGKMIAPYFSEPTNDEEQPLWRWVKSILEAGQQRRMNFEESWIIRACEDPRQARTLADVHKNIKDLLGGEGDYVEKGRGKKKKREWKYSRKPVTGINAGVYTSLQAYFDIVMPQLARLPYTKKLTLGAGLNVMDLREYAMETQALVIRSVMEWVYQHEKNVRVIVPEAQDFVPQGKNSPVKMACETLVRKAGANRNFMWLDSQDMAAVDKIMLRACSIVGIGVQTEGHEIDRSLASLFTPALKAVDIARLRIGEFFVRTPEAKVSKVYVQPAWMESELHAQAIAKGEESVASARQMLRAFKDSRESRVEESKASELPPTKRPYPGPPQLQQILSQEQPVTETDEVQNNDVEESESLPAVDAVSATDNQSENRINRAGNSDRHVGAAADDRTVRRLGRRPGFETEKKDSSPQILNESEPGKHEPFTETVQGKQTDANARDSGIKPDVADFEGILENGKLVKTVPGTPGSLRNSGQAGGRENRRGSREGAVLAARSEKGVAMPQAKTPFEILKDCYRGSKDGLPTFDRTSAKESVTFMNAAHGLLQEHALLIEAHDALAKEVSRLRDVITGRGSGLQRASDESHVAAGSSLPDNGHGLRFTVPDLDYIWKYVRAQATKDPGVLQLILRQPELRIKIERQTVEMDDSTLIGRIAKLLHEGWFKQPKNGPAVQKELKRRGCEQPTTNLYKPLNRLTEMGFLTLESEGYQEVAEMKTMVQKV